MTPFRRGKGPSRGIIQGAVDARGTGRGQGRGRDRGTRPYRGHTRSIFHSTRIENPLDDDAQSERTFIDEKNNGDVHAFSASSSSEAEDESAETGKPYDDLLQSLNADTKRMEPQRKKRKFQANDNQRQACHIKGLSDQIMTSKLHKDASSFAKPDEEIKYESKDEGEDIFTSEDSDKASDTEHEDPVNDPFLKHVEPDEDYLITQTQDIQNGNQTMESNLQSTNIWECNHRRPLANVGASRPVPRTTKKLRLQDLGVKHKLRAPANKIFHSMSELERTVAASIFGYEDLLFLDRTPENAKDLRSLSCLHVLNHILKTRDRVIKHNVRLARNDNNDDAEYRDQGFTRPKVLIILPTKQSCVKYVESIISLCEPEQQENRNKFEDSYIQAEADFSDGKPEDFRELFGGNDNDNFRLGMKLTRKTVKYFSQFYNSDIIVASPLGLRMAIEGKDAEKEDFDFLSSIEILIMDQVDALYMQNWEHVDYLLQRLNMQPKEAHGCDFSRVRHWYLDGHAKFLRQTLTFAAYNFPQLNNIYSSHMKNVAGKVQYQREHNGFILDLGIQLKQTFSRYTYKSHVDDMDDRFDYFTATIIPSLTKHTKAGGGQGVLIFLPSFAEFLRVRNYMATSSSTENISFGSISEYTSVSDVARARSHFLSGRHAVLLYTQRAHHYWRYRLRGVKKIIMYGLPDNPAFYSEIVGGFFRSSIAEGKVGPIEASVRSIFSRLDMLKLERIVGSKRYRRLLEDGKGDTFEFT